MVLRGHRALVTGSATGIGRAIALAFARAGADVAVNYVRHEERAEEAAREIRAMGRRSLAVRADVSRESDVEAMFRRVLEEWGTIDVLVNNAGIQRDAPFDRMSLEDWRTVLDVNLTGSFLCARAAVREFRRRGVVAEVSRAAGKIICVTSVHELIPWAGRVNYAASKAGLMMLARSLAQETAPDRIRVNAIAPGAVRTAINRPAWEEERAREELLELIPYGRIGVPEDVARAAVWLASDESDYVTGATLFVDGGMALYPAFRTGG